MSEPVEDGDARPGTAKRILRFGAINVATTVVSSLCHLGFVVLLARWYPTSVVGAFGVGLAYYALFSALTGAGLSGLVYRETASDPAGGESLFHLAVGLRLRLAVLMLGGGLPVMFLIGGSRASFLWVVLGGATNYISDPALNYMNGRLRFGLVGAIVTAQRLIPLVMLLALAEWRSNALPGVCYFVGAATTSVYALGAAGLERRRLGLDRKAVFRALHVSWPLAALSLGDAFAVRITTLFLGLFRGAPLAGVYTPIASLSYGAASLAMAAFQPLIPVLGDRERPAISTRIVRFSVVLFVGLGLGAGLSQVLLERGYLLVLGTQPSSQVLYALRLLVVGLVPWIMSVWFIMYMQVLRDYRAVFWPSVIGTSTLIVVGIPLVWLHGIVGAAIASLAGDTLRMICAGGWFIRSARGSVHSELHVAEPKQSGLDPGD